MTDPKDIKNLAAAALEANATVDDLVRPLADRLSKDYSDELSAALDEPQSTEERVREVVEALFEYGERLTRDTNDTADGLVFAAIDAIETLSAENKALRQGKPDWFESELYRRNPLLVVDQKSGKVSNTFNPDTHVPMPKEPTPELIAAILPMTAYSMANEDIRIAQQAVMLIEGADSYSDAERTMGVEVALDLIRDYRAMLAAQEGE